MEADANGEQAEADRRAARLALVRAYLQAPDAPSRETLLVQMVASLSAEERAAGTMRLRDWAFDRLPPDLEQTPDYARYQDLLPLALAGTLDPQSGDAAWFQSYLEQCDPCFAEYQELRHALDAERADDDAPDVAGTVGTGRTFVEQSFVQETGAPYTTEAVARATAAWRTPFRAEFARQLVAGQPQLRIRFAAGPRPDPTLEAEEKTLVAQVIDRDIAPELAQPYTLHIEAQRLDPTTCQLVVQLGGAGTNAGLPVRLERPDDPAQEGVTDARGIIRFTLPIVALPQATLLLSLEPARGQQ